MDECENKERLQGKTPTSFNEGKLELHAKEDVIINPKILYFGTPVVLISSMDTEGNVNLSPMSSAWALGKSVILGLSTLGKTFENLRTTGELTLNFPDKHIWKNVELLAPLTGKDPVPESKKGLYRYERNKFEAANLTELRAQMVKPPMVKECPIRMEAIVKNIYPVADTSIQAASVEVLVIRVHAISDIVLDQNHIDPEKWKPLIYSFRHYFSLDEGYGKTFKSDV